MSAPNIETIVSLSKRRGFVFPASDIYGGLGSSWDYGQLGVELANNIKRSWWNWLVYERDDIEGLDSSIIQNRLVWKYSGHEQTFHDPLVDCRTCKNRFRLDKLVDVDCPNHPGIRPGEDKPAGPPVVVLDGWDLKAKHNVFNSLVWGPDGWLYGCNGITSRSNADNRAGSEGNLVASSS